VSLYLGLFDGDTEVAGWCFGHYSDFGCFRDVVASVADQARYPVLMGSSDCDSHWSPQQQRDLIDELAELAEIFRSHPPRPLKEAFEHTEDLRSNAKTLYDCFHNVDGENVFEALTALCRQGSGKGLLLIMQ